jgi:hypothetical protein
MRFRGLLLDQRLQLRETELHLVPTLRQPTFDADQPRRTRRGATLVNLVATESAGRPPDRSLGTEPPADAAPACTPQRNPPACTSPTASSRFYKSHRRQLQRVAWCRTSLDCVSFGASAVSCIASIRRRWRWSSDSRDSRRGAPGRISSNHRSFYSVRVLSRRRLAGARGAAVCRLCAGGMTADATEHPALISDQRSNMELAKDRHDPRHVELHSRPGSPSRFTPHSSFSCPGRVRPRGTQRL